MEWLIQASLNTIRSHVPAVTMSSCLVPPFCYLTTEISPGVFLSITRMPSGLPSGYTLHHSISFLPDGPHLYETISSIFPFFPTQE